MTPEELADLMRGRNTDKSTRQRAPRRTGHRAQLTVPEDMWRQVREIAKAAGTTPNDVLIRLASERLVDRQRAAALRRRAEKRWQAFSNGGQVASDNGPVGSGSTTKPLSEQELVGLSKAFREDV